MLRDFSSLSRRFFHDLSADVKPGWIFGDDGLAACPNLATGGQPYQHKAVLIGIQQVLHTFEQFPPLGAGQEALKDGFLAPAGIVLEHMQGGPQAAAVGDIVGPDYSRISAESAPLDYTLTRRNQRETDDDSEHDSVSERLEFAGFSQGVWDRGAVRTGA